MYGVEDEEFGEVALLAQKDMDERVGISEIAHGDDSTDGSVEGDHSCGIAIGEDEILHRHEVEEVHDEAVQRLFLSRWKCVVGDILEVENDLYELFRHGVEVGLPVGSVELLDRELE